MNDRKALLALDPGFRFGIKCAVLSDDGKVISLDTVKFLDGARADGKKKLISLLEGVREASPRNSSVLVVLGNGHGTREARSLVNEAASDGNIETEVHSVSEAGVSVWSVTAVASEEFPNEAPAAIASVSIGRMWVGLEGPTLRRLVALSLIIENCTNTGI